jgi:hypothetical protein
MVGQTSQYSNPIYTYGFVGDYNIFSPLYRSFSGMPIVSYILLGGTTLFLAYVTLIDNAPDNVDAAYSENKPFGINFGGKRGRKTAARHGRGEKNRSTARSRKN